MLGWVWFYWLRASTRLRILAAASHQIPDPIEQALLTIPLPANTTLITPFGGSGIDPQQLVGNHLRSYSDFDCALASITLHFSDGTNMVLTHAHAATWDEGDDGDEPEMELWDALEEAMNSRSRPSSKQVTSKQAENEGGHTHRRDGKRDQVSSRSSDDRRGRGGQAEQSRLVSLGGW